MATTVVGSTSGLLGALGSARPGDVILLEPGTYSSVVLRNFSFDGPVTIRSKDPSDPAVFQGLKVRDSSGLSFCDLELAVNPAGVIHQNVVLNSSDIHFSRIEVHGSLNGNPADDQMGLMVRNSSNVSVKHSEFHELAHGLSHLDSRGLEFVGNSFHDIRSDGIRGGGSSDVLVSQNYFTDFYPAEADHPDAIQFWTTNTTAGVRNITVTGNVVVRGEGGPIQGVFMRDGSGTMPFQDVTITDNLVLGTRYHGISVNGVDGLTVTGNSVVSFADQRSWIRADQASDASLAGNWSSLVLLNRNDLTTLGNTKIDAVIDGGLQSLTQWTKLHSTLTSLPDILGSGEPVEPALPTNPEPEPAPQPVAAPSPTPAPSPMPEASSPDPTAPAPPPPPASVIDWTPADHGFHWGREFHSDHAGWYRWESFGFSGIASQQTSVPASTPTSMPAVPASQPTAVPPPVPAAGPTLDFGQPSVVDGGGAINGSPPEVTVLGTAKFGWDFKLIY